MALMILLGATFRNDKAVHEKVVQAIDSFCEGSAHPQSHARRTRSAAATERTLHSVSLPAAEASELSRYSMVLHEYLSQRREQLSWNETRLTVHPPAFEASVSIQGLSFTGAGSNKKVARHLAAREACESLGITVN